MTEKPKGPIDLDSERQDHEHRRAMAAAAQGDWSWRLMLALGAGNGSGLLLIGSMLGAGGFPDHAVRAFTGAVVCFLLGVVGYGFATFARWVQARFSAERHNQELQSIKVGFKRDRATGLSSFVPERRAEAKALYETAKRSGHLAELAMNLSWLVTFAAFIAWILGVGLVGRAIYSGALRSPAPPAVARTDLPADPGKVRTAARPGDRAAVTEERR
jgi:hypothetical protein